MSPSTRRQNHSCDPCRRTKRRCALPASDDRSGPNLCINCTRLGNACTYDFAELRTAKKPKSRPLRKNNNERRTRMPGLEAFSPETDGTQHNTTVCLTDPNLNAAGEYRFDDQTDTVDQDWLNYGILWSPVFLDTPVIEAEEPVAPPVECAKPLTSYGPVSTSLAISSPMQLLNASITASTANNILSSLYDKALAGASSRFLNFSCNSLAGIHLYCLGDENSSQELAATSYQQRGNDLCPGLNSKVSAHSAAEGRMNQATSTLAASYYGPSQVMTVLGVVRFLDHFGELYGNKVDSADLRESSDVLRFVVQAFSMQWLPRSDITADDVGQGKLYQEPLTSCNPSESGTRVFLETWFRARSALLNARSKCSFKMIFAAFLFNMTVRPTGHPMNNTNVGQPHEFLDESLNHLSVLDGLVQNYCKILGSTSTYAKYMCSCLNVMRWFGRIRDTVSSFMGGRECRLSDCLDPYGGESLPSASINLSSETHTIFSVDAFDFGAPSPVAATADLDNPSDPQIHEICQIMMFHIFQNWRRTLRVKANFEKEELAMPSIMSQISDNITSAIAGTIEFDRMFGRFLQDCQQRFSSLSPAYRTSSGMSTSLNELRQRK